MSQELKDQTSNPRDVPNVKPLSDAQLKQAVLENQNINTKKEQANLLNMPTEVVSLPSEGAYYPKDSLLSNGKIEMKMMTAKEEDILASKNLLKKGIAIDRMLESLILDKIKLDDLLQPDYDALVIASRILGYGPEYKIKYTDPDDPDGNELTGTIDLTTLETVKPEDFDPDGENEFEMELPYSKVHIKFKILTVGDVNSLKDQDSNAPKAARGPRSERAGNALTSRLGKMITEVQGETNPQVINKFVENMIARDSKALRAKYKSILPKLDTDITIYSEYSGKEHTISLPMGTEFFWPEV